MSSPCPGGGGQKPPPSRSRAGACRPVYPALAHVPMSPHAFNAMRRAEGLLARLSMPRGVQPRPPSRVGGGGGPRSPPFSAPQMAAGGGWSSIELGSGVRSGRAPGEAQRINQAPRLHTLKGACPRPLRRTRSMARGCVGTCPGPPARTIRPFEDLAFSSFDAPSVETLAVSWTIIICSSFIVPFSLCLLTPARRPRLPREAPPSAPLRTPRRRRSGGSCFTSTAPRVVPDPHNLFAHVLLPLRGRPWRRGLPDGAAAGVLGPHPRPRPPPPRCAPCR